MNDSTKQLSVGFPGLSFIDSIKPLIINNEKEIICIINACQAEFGVIKNEYIKGGGYAWINSPQIKKNIRDNLNKCNKVILFLHAGMENQIIPLPDWKNIFHDFADLIQGNGAIIATHPHIVQGYEVYNDTPIFYSLGNFAFYKEELKNNKEWNRGIIVQYDTCTNEVKVVPVSIKDRLLDIDNSSEFNNEIEYRKSLVKNNNRLDELANIIAEKTWNDFYKSYYQSITNKREISSYTGIELIKIFIKRFFNKVLRTNYKINSESDFDETMLLHNIQIESHRFIVKRYLYNQNMKKNNFIEGDK